MAPFITAAVASTRAVLASPVPMGSLIGVAGALSFAAIVDRWVYRRLLAEQRAAVAEMVRQQTCCPTHGEAEAA